MVMDITGLTSNQTASSRAKVNEQSAPEQRAQGAPVADNSPAATGVSLSDAAQAIQKGVQQMEDSGASVNEQKVAELKAAIADGSYKVDYESTARSLFQLESQLDRGPQ